MRTSKTGPLPKSKTARKKVRVCWYPYRPVWGCVQGLKSGKAIGYYTRCTKVEKPEQNPIRLHLKLWEPSSGKEKKTPIEVSKGKERVS
ncbi:hypothetical protein NITGR_260042 [Nitrospina gracilis 3/211]|uniref:Uncharacterized protein n=1 Tax=Nitrospina gracilis (strain 3/211) TaxID=1266370 RepID=M1YX45_NITG3|nr:hypothetical protein NITGR_260042 [Nitrospina gracilis 3/211]